MSTYNDDEVFFCGSCRRQQEPRKGSRCVQCGKETIIWNTRRESGSAIQARWERMKGKD
jgi:hypothetical protein